MTFRRQVHELFHLLNTLSTMIGTGVHVLSVEMTSVCDKITVEMNDSHVMLYNVKCELPSMVLVFRPGAEHVVSLDDVTVMIDECNRLLAKQMQGAL